MQGVLYGSVGFGCGLIGQGIANMIMTAKRYVCRLIISEFECLAVWFPFSHFPCQLATFKIELRLLLCLFLHCSYNII